VIKAQQALTEQKKGARIEDIDQARAQVLQAQGQVETIQTQINDTVIRAPFSGVVTAKYADPGALSLQQHQAVLSPRLLPLRSCLLLLTIK
jgi:HlyD family secretion protein